MAYTGVWAAGAFDQSRQVERELGPGFIDAWIPLYKPGAPRCHIRAFPPRLVHIMAGNGPPAATTSIIQGALTKGINLLKLPSNDLFTATAILRTMADIDPNHPTLRGPSPPPTGAAATRKSNA